MQQNIIKETHPNIWQARLVRSLRFMRSIRGWHRFSRAVVPTTLAGGFTVRTGPHVFSGNLDSFIDRIVYLEGGYEQDRIGAFLEIVPPTKRGIILDIGANVGTHSLPFSGAFREVHAFEPNEALWPSFKANMAINNVSNVTLHGFGLGLESGRFPFYNIDKDNHGLGTLLCVEQYDLPLRLTGTVRVEIGDEIVETEIKNSIDAIKIDVQGSEPQVLSGLRRTIRRDRPILWLEIGPEASETAASVKWLRDLFGGDIRLLRFERAHSLLFNRTQLRRVNSVSILGDYVIIPV